MRVGGVVLAKTGITVTKSLFPLDRENSYKFQPENIQLENGRIRACCILSYMPEDDYSACLFPLMVQRKSYLCLKTCNVLFIYIRQFISYDQDAIQISKTAASETESGAVTIICITSVLTASIGLFLISPMSSNITLRPGNYLCKRNTLPWPPAHHLAPSVSWLNDAYSS